VGVVVAARALAVGFTEAASPACGDAPHNLPCGCWRAFVGGVLWFAGLGSRWCPSVLIGLGTPTPRPCS